MDERRQSIYVTLRYRDAAAAIKWLEATLRFIEREIHEEDDGTIAHAQLAFGSDLIMLGSGEATAAQTIYLAHPDADELHAHVQAMGANITRPIETTTYGSREFSIVDPEGNTWAVGTYQPTA